MPSVVVNALFESVGDPWMFTTCVATGDKDWAGAGAAFNAAVIANLLPNMGSDTTFLGSDWHDAIEQEVPGQFVPADADSAGGAGLSLPAEVGVVVTKYTESYGRGKQGRWFLAGLPQESYVGGSMDPDFRVTVQDGVTAFAAALSAASQVILVARMNRAVSPPTLISTDIVSRLVVRPILRGQRRRQHLRSIRGRRRSITPAQLAEAKQLLAATKT